MRVSVSHHALLRYLQRVDQHTKAREIARKVEKALEPGFEMRRRGVGYQLVTRDARYLLAPDVEGWTLLTVMRRKRHRDAD